MKRYIILIVCMLNIMCSLAQTENPYGLYKLQYFSYENGSKKVPTFEQYKYCGKDITLTFQVKYDYDHSTTFLITRNNKENLKYTGKRSFKDADKSTQVYDSNRRKFTMSWYNTTEHGDYFPLNEWIIEQYDSEEGINPKIKDAVSLFQNTALNGGKKLTGCWHNVGNWIEKGGSGYLRSVTDHDSGIATDYHIINSRYWISLPVSRSEADSFIAGCEINIYEKLKDDCYLCRGFYQTPDYTYTIRWLTDYAIIVQYNDYPQELWIRSDLPSVMHNVFLEH